MRIAVIGAGVIGTTTAWELLRQGHHVVLLEAGPGPGLVTSYANGGQLSYDYVAPLADPGVFADLPKWLLNPASPLRFRPRVDTRQWCWLMAFLQACNGASVRASTTALLQLSYLSRDTLHAWLGETPLEFHHRRNGKLIAYRSPALLEKARKQVAYQARHGSKQRILERAESVEIEPALANLGTALAGCVYTPTEEAGDCYLFTRGLFERIQGHPNAETHLNARVARLSVSGTRVTGVVLEGGETVEAEQVVLANGLQSYELLRQHGERVALYGLKGYSLSVPLPDPSSVTTQASPSAPPAAPDISVTDYERRIVYARLGNVLRIAAMVDMGDATAAIRPDRIRHLKNEVHRAFPQLAVEQAEPWAGERPATPEGRPIVGPSRKLANLWLNVGHGALGFTLACGSAVLLRAQMTGNGATPIDATPFQAR